MFAKQPTFGGFLVKRKWFSTRTNGFLGWQFRLANAASNVARVRKWPFKMCGRGLDPVYINMRPRRIVFRNPSRFEASKRRFY